MIQMRENRYNDIRNGIVDRSSETSDYKASSVDSESSFKSRRKSGNPAEPNPDPRANQEDEYLDDEYNSWS